MQTAMGQKHSCACKNGADHTFPLPVSFSTSFFRLSPATNQAPSIASPTTRRTHMPTIIRPLGDRSPRKPAPSPSCSLSLLQPAEAGSRLCSEYAISLPYPAPCPQSQPIAICLGGFPICRGSKVGVRSLKANAIGTTRDY